MLSKYEKDIIRQLEGSEVMFKARVVLIEYPYIFSKGVKKKMPERDWKKIVAEFWDNPSNEGYWLLREFKEEFEIKKKKDVKKVL